MVYKVPFASKFLTMVLNIVADKKGSYLALTIAFSPKTTRPYFEFSGNLSTIISTNSFSNVRDPDIVCDKSMMNATFEAAHLGPSVKKKTEYL